MAFNTIQFFNLFYPTLLFTVYPLVSSIPNGGLRECLASALGFFGPISLADVVRHIIITDIFSLFLMSPSFYLRSRQNVYAECFMFENRMLAPRSRHYSQSFSKVIIISFLRCVCWDVVFALVYKTLIYLRR